MFTVNRNPTHVELARFGSAMLLGFSGLAAALWIIAALKADASILAWRDASAQVLAIALVGLGATLFVISKSSVPATRTIYVAWMTATVPVGVAMSTVMLTLLFVLLLPVFSFIVRLGDPLRKKLRGSTYWEDYKPHEPTLERMKRPF